MLHYLQHSYTSLECINSKLHKICQCLWFYSLSVPCSVPCCFSEPSPPCAHLLFSSQPFSHLMSSDWENPLPIFFSFFVLNSQLLPYLAQLEHIFSSCVLLKAICVHTGFLLAEVLAQTHICLAWQSQKVIFLCMIRRQILIANHGLYDI